MPHYRYTNENDQPLQLCPGCDESLTEPNAVTLTVSINETPKEFTTNLDQNGNLVDVDSLVDNGYHSATLCAGCGELLLNFDEVTETNTDTTYEDMMDESNGPTDDDEPDNTN